MRNQPSWFSPKLVDFINVYSGRTIQTQTVYNYNKINSHSQMKSEVVTLNSHVSLKVPNGCTRNH